jgi:hypothetical protein
MSGVGRRRVLLRRFPVTSIVSIQVMSNNSMRPLRLFVVYYESIKRKLKTKYIWGVGVMKDYNLTLRNLLASHTLSWSWNWNT